MNGIDKDSVHCTDASSVSCAEAQNSKRRRCDALVAVVDKTVLGTPMHVLTQVADHLVREFESKYGVCTHRDQIDFSYLMEQQHRGMVPAECKVCKCVKPIWQSRHMPNEPQLQGITRALLGVFACMRSKEKQKHGKDFLGSTPLSQKLFRHRVVWMLQHKTQPIGVLFTNPGGENGLANRGIGQSNFSLPAANRISEIIFHRARPLANNSWHATATAWFKMPSPVSSEETASDMGTMNIFRYHDNMFLEGAVFGFDIRPVQSGYACAGTTPPHEQWQTPPRYHARATRWPYCGEVTPTE